MDNPADANLTAQLLALVPSDGSTIGNGALRKQLAAKLGRAVEEYEYIALRDRLLADGVLARGPGRGGSVRRAATGDEPFALAAREVRDAEVATPPPRQKSGRPGAARRPATDDPQVTSYRHLDRRANNPEVGMVDPASDPDDGKTRYAYDPHLDPALQFDVGRAQVERIIDDALTSNSEPAMREALLTLKRLAEPYLAWSGKAERTSFEVDTVSLHVHERIDPATILRAVQKRLKEPKPGAGQQQDWLQAWFDTPLPYREAIEFYRHDRGWSNRLITGDSLLVMNSLLQKEGMAGQVQMIYIDPPYGIKYGSNFQPFVSKRDVKDRKDEDLTQEPEMIKAFRDTWELGIHSYLAYLRDRLLLARELLSESGSIFVQISDENVHLVRNVMDDVFGVENFVCEILVKKKGAQKSSLIDPVNDYLVWYGRSARGTGKIRFRPIFEEAEVDSDLLGEFRQFDDGTGRERSVFKVELTTGEVFDYRNSPRRLKQDFPHSRLLRSNPLTSGGLRTNQSLPWTHWGKEFHPGANACWKATARNPEGGTPGMARLGKANRFVVGDTQLAFKRYTSDFGYRMMTNWWDGLGGASSPVYVVQTNEQIVQRCLLMTTEPGDLVLDPTCGSGTTALVAEKWGRRWITCDTSRVAVTLAKQRLMTASFDYYELKYPHEGLKGGFIYKTVPHVTLKSIANNPEIDEIYERLHPAIEAALADLNATLRRQGKGLTFAVAEGGRKGDTIDFGAPADATTTLPSGEAAPRGALLEWEVPFDFPDDWPAAARSSFEAFHQTRQAMQARMDASIAAHADSEVLYDQPEVSRSKRRVSGPFTVEAVPSPMVLSLDDQAPAAEADVAIARSGYSSRHHQWRDELAKTGIRGKGGQILKLADLETLPDTRHLHLSGTVADSGDRVVVSFGPEHSALEQRQVELAIREAGELFPRPKMIVFCAFAFDPEAAKDIDAVRGITALKAQMNTDLLTEDLKKARSSNQSFWLMGQPDVELRRLKDGRWQVEVHGFDYFDTVKGELVSGGKSKIAAWALDTDYDERSLFPRQVFFPMAGAKDGWHKLKKDVKAELDESLLGKLHGTVSLPFEAGENRKVAVKIVDDRGIESLKIIRLE
jgi:adenine-specific DNA-methyltransferase